MAYTTRTKAVPEEDDDLVNDTTGIGGDEYFPMEEDADADMGDDVDAPVDDMDEPTDDQPPPTDSDTVPPGEEKPGALVIREIHDHIHDIGEACERGSRMQEHPEVQKALDQFMAVLDKELSKFETLHLKLYPDHEQPGAGAEPLPDEIEKGLEEGSGSDGGYMVDDGDDVEPDGDEDDDPAFLKKRVRQRKRFLKRLDLARAWRALTRAKRYGGDHATIINKAADHLEEIGDHDGEWSPLHKAACHYHAKSLRGCQKSFDAAPQMDADPGMGAGGMPDEMIKRYRAEIEASVKAEYEAKASSVLARLASVQREAKALREGR